MKKNLMYTKRLVSAALCAVMTLSLAACGGKRAERAKDSDTVDEVREYVYVPEYLDFVDSEEGTWFGNMMLAGDYLYFNASTWDEEKQESSERIMKYSLKDGSTEVCVERDEESSIERFAVDKDQNIYIASSIWQYEEDDYENADRQYFLNKYSADGSKVYEQEFTEIMLKNEENAYVQYLAVDAKGRLYISSENLIRLFDEQGQYVGEIETSTDWIDGLSLDDEGNVYFSYWDYSGTGAGMALAEVDFEGKKAGKTYSNLPGGANYMSPVGEKAFLLGDSTSLYQYDCETQTYDTVLKWLDSDINGDYVDMISQITDGEFLAVVNDWNSNETELVKLTRTKASEVVQKTEITIGTLYQSQSLQAAAVAFNKANGNYRIRIKTYMDENNWSDTSYEDAITRLNNDLTSGGNAPDLIDLSVVDEAQLVSKNAIEDLTAYLEKSSKLSVGDFAEGILDKFKVDGVLTGIPRTVQINTFVGKTSVVGDRSGWTLSDMIQISDKYPDAEIFNGATRTEMLYYFLLLNEGAFIDWESGKCSFDSPEFVQMLEFVNRFPEEYDWNNYDGSVSLYQENRVLLDSAYVDGFNEIQYYEAKFGEPVTFIGFPTVDGSNGHALTAESRYAIASSSSNKDGAWEFIEYYLTRDTQMFDWGLYTVKEKLDKQIEDATKVEYIYDENGEIMYDEDGEPLTTGGGGMVSSDGWEYTYHTPTQEDVETALKIFKDAKPVSEGFDRSIISIIQEEAEGYFQGQKSSEEVASIIQNRLQNYVNENM
ncbi:MAG: extracellular solute-binding protein [Lachnospiraceae bacterium]|nr:extracellular solute-binding protein [Lachnospiraceae bacterium]